MRNKVNDIRSGLATRAFRVAVDRGGGARWLTLTSVLMPKSFPTGADIRISRRNLRRIVRDAAPHSVEALLDQLEARAPKSAWVAAFAAEYGLWRGDWALIERYLARCLSRLGVVGSQVPKRYSALLVASQIESRRFSDAKQTLSAHAPNPRRKSEDPFDCETDLLAAGTAAGDDKQWLACVNRFLSGSGLDTIELATEAGATKYQRLRASGRLANNGAAAPKVTIIVSCFNAEDYLEASLRSLVEQSYSNLEIIAVDDMSSDGTWDLLSAFARREKRLKLLQNAKNVGTYVSRNRALRASTGDYVTTQDSDDWSHPERIWRQLALLEDNPGAIASHCAGVRMWSDGRFEVHRSGRVVRELCYPSIMYRKKAIIGLTGYWDCVRVEADAEYLRRVLRLCGTASVRGCPEPLMIQLRRENSLTTLPGTTNIRGLTFGDRMTYREEASRFNKVLNAGNARYDFETWSRPFPAPAGIAIPDELVREAASWE